MIKSGYVRKNKKYFPFFLIERFQRYRSEKYEIIFLIFFLKLFKNQRYPFVDSKIFYTFAVQKVGLLLCECITY